DDPLLDGRTLVNAGDATVGSSVTAGLDGMHATSATIDNLAGATFRLTNTNPLFLWSAIEATGSLLFNNSGTLVKAGDSGETDFVNVELHNTRTVRIDGGTFGNYGDLVVNGNGVLTGQPGSTLLVPLGSTLQGDTRNAEYYGPQPTILFMLEPTSISSLSY